MTISVAAYYAADGNIRGSLPMDPQKRRQLIESGWQEKTINIGGNWVSYRGIPMFDMLLTGVADMVNFSGDMGEEQAASFQEKLAFTFINMFEGATPLDGVAELGQLFRDPDAFGRFLARKAGGLVPGSSNLNAIAKATDSVIKDIYDDFIGSMLNRIPGASKLLIEQIDPWTGQPVDRNDNPIQRAFNAFSPIKFYSGEEPWRKFLLEFDVAYMGDFRKDSKGFEYTKEERKLLMKYIGDEELYLQIEDLMKRDMAQRDLETVRALRSEGGEDNDVRVRVAQTQTAKYIRNLIDEAKDRAEAKLDSTNPAQAERREAQETVDNITRAGMNDRAVTTVEEANQLIEQTNY